MEMRTMMNSDLEMKIQMLMVITGPKVTKIPKVKMSLNNVLSLMYVKYSLSKRNWESLRLAITSNSIICSAFSQNKKDKTFFNYLIRPLNLNKMLLTKSKRTNRIMTPTN